MSDRKLTPESIEPGASSVSVDAEQTPTMQLYERIYCECGTQRSDEDPVLIVSQGYVTAQLPERRAPINEDSVPSGSRQSLVSLRMCRRCYVVYAVPLLQLAAF